MVSFDAKQILSSIYAAKIYASMYVCFPLTPPKHTYQLFENFMGKTDFYMNKVEILKIVRFGLFWQNRETLYLCLSK